VRFYSSLRKLSLTQRMNDLSIKLAAIIVDHLKATKTESPLFYLELTYQAVGSYWPSLLLFTKNDKEKAINERISPFLTGWTSFNWIYISLGEVEKDLQEFVQIIEETENWEAGTKMLR